MDTNNTSNNISIQKQGEGHRTHVSSALMRESLVSKALASKHSTAGVFPILPDCSFLFIGGQSIIDRGRRALLPLLDEIVKCRKEHKFVVGIGAGARLRHTFEICLDLGIPTGGLAMVAGAVDEQNQRMIWALLAQHNAISMNKENFLELPLWLEEGMIPITASMPPYHFWEPPNGTQKIPRFGQDIGIMLFADLLGAKNMIYLKDEDGLYTNDPKVDKAAKFIPEITAKEILDQNFPDLILEKTAIEALINTKSLKQVQVINGLKPELLSRALNGEHVGTIIKSS